jgi:hypothetical protein
MAAIAAGAYVSALINQPWARDGRHCWRLVVEVQRDLFGRTLPAVLESAPAGSRRPDAKAALFAEHEERARWIETTPIPAHGAIVLMHRRGMPADAFIHAGVYLALDAAASCTATRRKASCSIRCVS